MSVYAFEGCYSDSKKKEYLMQTRTFIRLNRKIIDQQVETRRRIQNCVIIITQSTYQNYDVFFIVTNSLYFFILLIEKYYHYITVHLILTKNDQIFKLHKVCLFLVTLSWLQKSECYKFYMIMLEYEIKNNWRQAGRHVVHISKFVGIPVYLVIFYVT